MDEPVIDCRVRAGDLGAVVEQHGRLYRAEYGFDVRFEAYVAAGLAAAAQSPSWQDTRLWLVREGDRLMGSAAVCPAGEGTGQFRWFLLEPELRGHGIGRKLLGAALEHTRAVGYHRVFLWTVDLLHAAAALYRGAGFVETERGPETAPWGVTTAEVRYDLDLAAGPAGSQPSAGAAG